MECIMFSQLWADTDFINIFQMAAQLSQLHLCNYSSFPNGLRLYVFSYLYQVLLGLLFLFHFLYIHTQILCVATYNVSSGIFHTFLMIKCSFSEEGSNDSMSLRDVAHVGSNNALKSLP